MFFTYEKQHDGSYYILKHDRDYPWRGGVVEKTGVRGCNVERVISSLEARYYG